VAAWASVKVCPRHRRPARYRPQLAFARESPPEGDDWLHQLKLDGGSAWATGGQGVWESEFAGFAKFIVVKKPATRKGINPFTKEPTVVKAKPERRS